VTRHSLDRFDRRAARRLSAAFRSRRAAAHHADRGLEPREVAATRIAAAIVRGDGVTLRFRGAR
jgi:hypothetical protein